jgi:hypothetical protein
MKKIIFTAMAMIFLASCAITIPMQTNLSDQTMLLAKNKDIKANYTIVSNIPDGFIPYVTVYKNGTRNYNTTSHKYSTETAFKKVWSSYFANKYNTYSTDVMDVTITLKNIELNQIMATSSGGTLLTGNTKYTIEAIAKVHVIVEYKGKQYENEYEVTSSDYNETQQMQAGSYTFTQSHANPTAQKSELLQSCINRSIIQFENFMYAVIFKEKE